MGLLAVLGRVGKRGGAVGSATALMVGATAAQAMMAVALLLIARQLGADAYGRYTASFAACGMAAVLFSFGLDTWLLREGALDPSLLDRRLGQVLAFKLVLGIPWAVALVLLLPAVARETFPRALVALAATATLADGLFTAVHAAFKASLRNRLTAATLVASRGLILVGALFLATSANGTPTSYAAARTAAVIVGLLLCLPFARAIGPWSARRGLPGTGGEGLSFARLGRRSLPFAVSDLFTIVYAQADIVIVAAILGSRAAGLYSPASSLVNALFVVPSAVYSVATPLLVRGLVAGDRRRLRRLFEKALAAFAAIGMLLAAATAISSGSIVPLLLGRSFTDSSSVLTILSPILLLKSLSFGFASLLVAVGWQRQRVWVQGASMLANLGLNLAFVWQYGIAAAAWVYVGSEAILMAGYGLLAWRWWRSGPALPKGLAA